MRNVVNAFVLIGMAWGGTLAWARPNCVTEVYGSPYGFSYLVHPPTQFTSIWTTVVGRPYVLELSTVGNPLSILQSNPGYLKGAIINRGQYKYDEFEQKHETLKQYHSGQLYLVLLSQIGNLLANTQKDLSHEYFMLAVLNRRDWHEVPLHNLALYSARQMVPTLPSLSDFHAILRQNGNDRAAVDRDFFKLVLSALESLRPQLMGTFNPLDRLLARVRDENRFEIVEEDQSIDLQEGLKRYEFDVTVQMDPESPSFEHQVGIVVNRRSHLWDDGLAPFILLDMALYDDYLGVFENQWALLTDISGPRSLVPAELLEPVDLLDEVDDYLYASSAAAIELSPRQADLMLDLMRQYRNFGLELIP